MPDLLRKVQTKVRKAIVYAPIAVGRALLIRSYPPSNWGDALSPVLAQEISGLPTVNINDAPNPLHRPVYSLTGSILGWAMKGNAADHVIWGSGFFDASETLKGVPGRICAVRGPLTRARILELGVECPEIFGDPALLYPRFYQPSVSQEYALGIIPHIADQDSAWVRAAATQPNVKIIDVTLGVQNFVDDLLKCHAIASSSLHGIIAADAYGIPSVWIELSDRVWGAGFKFRDYFASVHKPITQAVVVEPSTTVTELVDQVYSGGIEIDLDQLMAACPLPTKRANT